MVSAITITYHGKKHTKIFNNENAKPTSVTWIGCVITTARGQGLCWLQPPLHWALIGTIPVLLSALQWTDDFACNDWGWNEGFSQDGQGCAQGSLAQLAPGWGTMWASAFFLWLLCLSRLLKKCVCDVNMDSDCAWNKLRRQHLHTFSAAASWAVSTKTFLKQGLSVNTHCCRAFIQHIFRRNINTSPDK